MDLLEKDLWDVVDRNDVQKVTGLESHYDLHQNKDCSVLLQDEEIYPIPSTHTSTSISKIGPSGLALRTPSPLHSTLSMNFQNYAQIESTIHENLIF